MPDATSGACEASVVYEGTSYVGLRLDRPVRHAERLRGFVPGCDDTGVTEIGPDGRQTDRTPPPEPDRPVRLRRIRGVPRALAVAREGDRTSALLAAGYFPSLAGHPLHGRVDVAPQQRRCRGRTTLAGRVDGVNLAGVSVRVRGGRHFEVAIVRDTRIEGFRRAGEPHLQAGDLVRVGGRRCAGRRRLAARIAPAP